MKTAVITGANSGIGKEISMELARRGYRVALVCRNPERGEEARVDVARDSGRDDVELLQCDLSSQDSVRRLGDALHKRLSGIDVLVHNAGVYLPKRLVTDDGLEMTIATNHLGPFLLTQLVLDMLGQEGLRKDELSRVVTVSSGAHKMGRLNFDDLGAERGYGAMRQYGASKLMNILFTRELARREAERLTANCYHPGAVGTGFAQDEPGALNLLMKVGKVFLRTPERGARTGIYLADSEEVSDISGEYFVDERVRKPAKQAQNDDAARRLWTESERLVGL